MKIHEYQAKQLLASYGAPIPLGDVADTPAEVLKVWNRIG
ncbi:TPA: succinate--CoA ligase subunit beta, partial [bacterium]|nr:succinate--CoA ligase subunit beta [bacterium]